MSSNKTTYRNKVIIVPYARLSNDNAPLFLLFKDASSGDWTFATGGCKQREDVYSGACRELLEESRNTLLLSSLQNLETFTFQSSFRPPTHAAVDAKYHIKVITRYTVYIGRMPLTSSMDINKYKNKYKSSVVGNDKAYNETNDVEFATLTDLLTNKYKLWSFMRDEVVPKIVSIK